MTLEANSPWTVADIKNGGKPKPMVAIMSGGTRASVCGGAWWWAAVPRGSAKSVPAARD